MKRVVFCFAALYCAIQFAGCQTNFDQEFENNLIRLSDEHTSRRFHNGDDINFYYHCEFTTEVDFAIKAEDDTILLQQDEATLKPGEGFLTFNINTNGYEGKAFVYITYNTIKPVGKRKSKDIGTYIWDVTITNEGSWYYHTEAINELLETCKDFDAETLIAGIEGSGRPIHYLSTTMSGRASQPHFLLWERTTLMIGHIHSLYLLQMGQDLAMCTIQSLMLSPKHLSLAGHTMPRVASSSSLVTIRTSGA